MSFKDRNPKPPTHTECIDPAPWLGRVGDGATLPSGEFISRQLREMVEYERAHREEERTHREEERLDVALDGPVEETLKKLDGLL